MGENRCVVKMAGRLDKRFDLQYTTNLMSGWESVATLYSEANRFSFEHGTNGLTGFYRMVEWPGTNQPAWKLEHFTI
jgi:hypothetical protein